MVYIHGSSLGTVRILTMHLLLYVLIHITITSKYHHMCMLLNPYFTVRDAGKYSLCLLTQYMPNLNHHNSSMIILCIINISSNTCNATS